MSDLKLLNEVAYMEEDCPRCGGSNSGVRSGQEGRYPLDCACSLCGGSGKVFVLPEMVRVECPTCSKVRNRGGTILHCSECSDGTVASEKMQDWIKAAAGIGLHRVIDVTEIFVAPDPFEALIAALEAANGKEKGWLKRESSVE
ncbi:hypothetical protein LCGC14_2853690 [marine sediment metagenome]|uniref:Uncharacterized protein n=1 Tax=marine sediment metagenome TaxID=412755 RepID=A0A0F9AG08_9ZZZZ